MTTSSTTMHFGPEWMRAKPQTSFRPHAPPSPPPPVTPNTQQTNASTYSALVAPAAPEPDKRDEFRPFRYSKEAMLRIYKEGGGRGGLGLEVERWEGIVHEISSEPTALREMGDAEKKLFAGPLNSELRRRQSSDLINTLSSPSDRPRLNHSNTGGGSPMRGFGLVGRRKDSIDQPPLTLPRKLSLSITQGNPPTTTRDGSLLSPRTRIGGFSSGFDGVLNGGESWIARRRISESMVKHGGTSTVTHPEGKEEDVKSPNMKKVEESTTVSQTIALQTTLSGASQQSSPIADALPPDTTDDSQIQLTADSVTRRMAGISLGENERTNSNLHSNPMANSLATGPPPGLDPASIEWSYLDPQGQVQGPFKADLMQKWFDEGYFTPDLLMKRTHIDRDWTAVGILDRQAAGGKIFLSQFPISTGPPGLNIRADSSTVNLSPAHDHNTFTGYQPVPNRTLRTVTLDPYVDNASPSDSPPSSIGGGRFSNGSPESSAFKCRVGALYTGDSGFGSRGFNGNPAPFGDPVGDPRPLFSNVAPGRASSLDAFNNCNSSSNSPWPPSVTQNVQNFGNNEHSFATGCNNGTGPSMMSTLMPTAQNHSFTQEPSYGDVTYNVMGNLGSSYDSSIPRHPTEATGLSFSNLINGAPYAQHYPQPPAVPQQCSSTSPFGEVLTKVPESPDMQTPASAVQSEKVPSPWGAPESATVRRPVIDIPTPSPVAPPAAAWSQPPQRAPPQPKDPSPWLTASLGIVDDGWREIPGPNSLTVSNLGQHNKMYEEADDEDNIAVQPIGEEEDETTSVVAPEPVPEKPKVVPLAPIPVTATSHHIEPPPSAAPKTRLKSSVREVHPPTTASAPKPASPAPAPAVQSPSPVPKPAWVTEDDARKGKSLLSLREIQEVEAKKAEARKAAERDRVARVNAPPSPVVVEDVQPFTASWGLLTSQAGARAAVSPKGEAVGVSAASAPVWTTASTAPTKKTMKEIQEEEERGKKIAIKETLAATAARRGYAETTFKVIPSAQSSGGAWTTVGANGKLNAPAPAPTRSAVAPSVSTQGVVPAPRSNGTVVRPTTQIATKVTSSPRVDEAAVVPSHDFFKWLSDALKGLNHSVNLEEITQMLLSFPVDPDPSTSEIISDLIYANSTTLDGRRFAAEFVKRRRVSGAIVPGTNGNGKASIADVVKTTPRAAQPEWGFKVVNKKKKGRA